MTKKDNRCNLVAVGFMKYINIITILVCGTHICYAQTNKDTSSIIEYNVTTFEGYVDSNKTITIKKTQIFDKQQYGSDSTLYCDIYNILDTFLNIRIYYSYSSNRNITELYIGGIDHATRFVEGEEGNFVEVFFRKDKLIYSVRILKNLTADYNVNKFIPKNRHSILNTNLNKSAVYSKSRAVVYFTSQKINWE